MISKEFNLIKEDLIKIGKGAMIVGTGVACTYILENIGQIDFGIWSPLFVGVISILTNTILKFVNKTRY